ncbi:hypothetical protein [Sphingosinicella sp. LY1275]|uniref:hypothetical protein n=1 Tax=Sphingosinicella sp. LY1275 TaxID=3095379 RepID=UPI002ADEDE89|nr:hypothetical protein [Sphingosinicella sp. LY1275]MEA1015343.1 hypothetical protein [Sphingosinicella sp. LY1275]
MREDIRGRRRTSGAKPGPELCLFGLALGQHVRQRRAQNALQHVLGQVVDLRLEFREA